MISSILDIHRKCTHINLSANNFSFVHDFDGARAIYAFEQKRITVIDFSRFHRRIGEVVRAYASHSVDLGSITSSSYIKDFKNGIYTFHP